MGNYWVNVETVDKIICKIGIYKNMSFHCCNFYFYIDSPVIFLLDTLTLFKMEKGEGAKRSPYQFSPITSTNVGISPQNLPHWCKVSSSYVLPVPDY